MLFHFLLTRWWIPLSTTINPFHTVPLTCEIYLWPCVLTQNAHVDASSCTCTSRPVLFFTPFSSLLLPTRSWTFLETVWISLISKIQKWLLPLRAASDIWPPPRSSQIPPLDSSEIPQIRLMPCSDGYRRPSCLHISILMCSAYCCWHGQGCSARRADLWVTHRENLVFCTLFTLYLVLIIWVIDLKINLYTCLMKREKNQ